MAWRAAKSLDVLLKQVNAAFPNRSKVSDGTIGDAAHSSRASDHNPNQDGVVCARDFTHDLAHGLDARRLADGIISSRDERVKYIISNGQICSGPGASHPAWVWRPYSGANAHREHVHISVRSPAVFYDNTADWTLDASAIGSTLWIQQSLNKLGENPKLKEDGDEGRATVAAIRAFAVKALQKQT